MILKYAVCIRRLIRQQGIVRNLVDWLLYRLLELQLRKDFRRPGLE